jgi:hypothetical protein
LIIKPRGGLIAHRASRSSCICHVAMRPDVDTGVTSLENTNAQLRFVGYPDYDSSAGAPVLEPSVKPKHAKRVPRARIQIKEALQRRDVDNTIALVSRYVPLFVERKGDFFLRVPVLSSIPDTLTSFNYA